MGQSRSVRGSAEGIGLGDALWHHERYVATQLGQRRQHQPVGFFERHGKGAIVDHSEGSDEIHEFLPHAVTLAPALNGGDTIGSSHWRTVMPLQALAQGEGVGEAIRVLTFQVSTICGCGCSCSSSANKVS